jgi:hypothetical protein
MDLKPKFNRNPAGLKLVAGAPLNNRITELRAGGLAPDDSMAPGEYLASCEGGTITSKGQNMIAVLEFRILDGAHSGTAIRQWITIPVIDGIVPQGSRYARQCGLALSREIEPGDNLTPSAVFKGKLFRVQVGYRKTLKQGGTASDENALFRKDARDYLRVHQLISLEEFAV